MKKNRVMLIVTLIAFAGVYAQEDEIQDSGAYVEKLKDAYASSDENEIMPNVDDQEMSQFDMDQN